MRPSLDAPSARAVSIGSAEMSASGVLSVRPLGFPWQARDPFLMCAYHHDRYPAGNADLGPDAPLGGRQLGHDFDGQNGWRMYHGQAVPGFPVHPHVGFETVTIVIRGRVDHADSMGAAGRFGDGDVQWMTAGRGVQHSEMFPLLDQTRENELMLLQIWLNLPRASKQVDPCYSMIWHDEVAEYTTTDELGREAQVRVIAGEFNTARVTKIPPDSWAADPDNEVAIWLLQLQPGASLTLPATRREINRDLYFYQGGEVYIDDQCIRSGHAIALQSDQQCTVRNGDTESQLVLMQGRPINEPVVFHGPFVVNDENELPAVFDSYQRTQFGGWPWGRTDPTHGSGHRRFARYANGNEEQRD